METIVQILKADDLEPIMYIPPEMRDRCFEVTLRPVENAQVEKKRTFNINTEIMRKFLEAAESGEAKEHIKKKLAEGTQFSFDAIKLINGTMTEDDLQDLYSLQKQAWPNAAVEKAIKK